METLFNLPVQKYWDFTAKYSQEQKQREIINRINSNEYIGSEKIDGHYNRTVKDYDGTFRMESRTVSTVTGEHADKQYHVPHIAKELAARLPSGTVIIGELYRRGWTAQDVGKILQCKPEKAVARQEEMGKLWYYIHDVWYWNGEDLTTKMYDERMDFLDWKLMEIFGSNTFHQEESIETYDDLYMSHPIWCDTPASIKGLMERVFENDGEGIVLVRKDSFVEPGKRTAWHTIKVKRELDHHIDCFFTGEYKMGARLYTGKEIENWEYWENIKTGEKCCAKLYTDYRDGDTIEPVTKPYFFGWPGSLEIAVMDAGKIRPIGYLSGLPDEMKENYEDYKFCPCEVTCMQFTNDGNLRHAKLVRLRDDITPDDCTYDKIHG